MRLMQEHWAANGLGGILHCFTGTWPQAQRALDMGFMISFAGNVTFPKAQQIRDAALEVPLDRMLIETDSPYLAPVPHRGKRNEPAFVKETRAKARRVARYDGGRHRAENYRAISTIFSNWLKSLKAKFRQVSPVYRRHSSVNLKSQIPSFQKELKSDAR